MVFFCAKEIEHVSPSASTFHDWFYQDNGNYLTSLRSAIGNINCLWIGDATDDRGYGLSPPLSPEPSQEAEGGE